MNTEFIPLLLLLSLLISNLPFCYFSYKQEKLKVELLESINTKLDLIGGNYEKTFSD